jgi:glycosyltransferase involved in cell wall biosynthesis
MTRVSVILPVHDARAYLALALASLLEQSHRDIHVIAIDDGSTDGSSDILDAAANHDARVTVIRRENRGLVATLNEGLARADTDYIARMDADDIAYPNRLAEQLRAFELDPALGLLGTNFTTLFTATRIAPAAPPQLRGPGERGIFGRFCTSLRHPTVMVRRTRIGAEDLHYDPAYIHAEDFDLFRRVARTSAIAETAAPHLAYRIHGGSVSAKRLKQMCQTHLKILEENLAFHYPSAAGTGMERIAFAPDADSVDAAAEMIRRLKALLPLQPDTEKHAFSVGVTTTVHFIFALLCRGRGYGLAHRFVEQAGGHQWIRRRERAILPTSAAHVGMTLSGWQVDLQRLLGSSPLSRAVPGYGEIARRARRIEEAAGLGRSRHAA